MEKKALFLRDIEYSYPTNQEAVLKECSLSVAAGEWVALLGRSGSGKSTLGRICAGLLRPHAGQVQCEVRSVGWLAQNPMDQLLGATVFEDVAFAPHNQGLRGAELEARVNNALQAVGMVEKAQADPAAISGGERQRVALAGVLAMQPEVMILDEPASMVDQESRTMILGAVKHVVANGCAVLYITHSSSEALYADRVLVLSSGRIAYVGAPVDVLSSAKMAQAAGVTTSPLLSFWLELRSQGITGFPAEWSTPGILRALLEHKKVVLTCDNGGNS